MIVLDAFTPAECDTILAAGRALPSRQGMVYTSAGDGLVQRETYDCEERFPDDPWMLDRLTGCLRDAAYLVGQVTRLREKPRLLHYRIGGHFIWHQDAVEGTLPGIPPRVLTGVVHLSEDYEGGELDVGDRRKSTGDGWWQQQASRQRGVATLFPSVNRHRLRPVTRGERWALVFWGYA